jgi:hypothetical protein
MEIKFYLLAYGSNSQLASVCTSILAHFASVMSPLPVIEKRKIVQYLGHSRLPALLHFYPENKRLAKAGQFSQAQTTDFSSSSSGIVKYEVPRIMSRPNSFLPLCLYIVHQLFLFHITLR